MRSEKKEDDDDDDDDPKRDTGQDVQLLFVWPPCCGWLEQSCPLNWLHTCINLGAVDVSHMDDDDEDKEEKHSDSAEAVLHEFTYKIKNYFLESERGLRAT